MRLPSIVSLGVALLVAQPSSAAEKRVVVLDFTGSLPKETSELLSDQARGAAASALRGLGYSVVTKEYVAVILRDARSSGACTEGECEIDIGRSVGADLVVSAHATRIESTWLVNLKLHDTVTGRLLDARNATGKGQLELVRAVQVQTPALLRRGLQLPGAAVVDDVADSDARPEVPVPGAVHVLFQAPSSREHWVVMDDANRLCDAPCRRWVAPGSSLTMRHEADRTEDVWSVKLPRSFAYSEGAELEATPLAARSYWVGAVAGALAGFGVGYLAGSKVYDGAQQGSTCADMGRQACSVLTGTLLGVPVGALTGGWFWERSASLDVRRASERFAAPRPRRDQALAWFVSPSGVAVAGEF